MILTGAFLRPLAGKAPFLDGDKGMLSYLFHDLMMVAHKMGRAF
jgi:hypothetical protein